jgi:hypothetical protein
MLCGVFGKSLDTVGGCISNAPPPPHTHTHLLRCAFKPRGKVHVWRQIRCVNLFICADGAFHSPSIVQAEPHLHSGSVYELVYSLVYMRTYTAHAAGAGDHGTGTGTCHVAIKSRPVSLSLIHMQRYAHIRKYVCHRNQVWSCGYVVEVFVMYNMRLCVFICVYACVYTYIQTCQWCAGWLLT